MRDSVYQTVPTALGRVAERVKHFFQNLDHHLIQNAFDNFYKRCVMFDNQNGGQIENLL